MMGGAYCTPVMMRGAAYSTPGMCGETEETKILDDIFHAVFLTSCYSLRCRPLPSKGLLGVF